MTAAVGFAVPGLMDTLALKNLELTEDIPVGETLGYTTKRENIAFAGGSLSLQELEKAWEEKLEPVFPNQAKPQWETAPVLAYPASKRAAPRVGIRKPKALIPVFPGTNCEYDTASALQRAGADVEVMVIQNRTAADVAASVDAFEKKIRETQIIMLPGGFSGGDEPDGAGKFITAFFRNPKIKEAIHGLLKERDGLMCGICNGFQALIKLGLVPYGEIRDMDENCPTLTFNQIGRHQSRLVLTRVASNKSPWMAGTKPGEIYSVPISHGEGRFIAPEALIRELAENGQILTQYVDLDGNVTTDIQYNPNGSYYAIEGITSPDGRVLGKMGHAERIGRNLYRNVDGVYNMHLFESAAEFFRKN